MRQNTLIEVDEDRNMELLLAIKAAALVDRVAYKLS